jgi:hypothetical protein
MLNFLQANKLINTFKSVWHNSHSCLHHPFLVRMACDLFNLIITFCMFNHYGLVMINSLARLIPLAGLFFGRLARTILSYEILQ